jgi:hypothetical protein
LLQLIITKIKNLGNVPYVKEFDKMGNISNPIVKSLIPSFPNRKTRREGLNKTRFVGNGKNFHLTVFGSDKYKRVRQKANGKDGELNVIEHYLKN